MKKKISFYVFSIIFVLTIVSSSFSVDTLYAGLRCSSYGFWPMPSAKWLSETSELMALRFYKKGRVVIPSVIWIYCTFDYYTTEDYLDYFDDHGVKVLLQTEPYEESVLGHITEGMDDHSDHPCVIGYGVDIEWYYPEENDGLGRKVTDRDAQQWRARVQQYGSQYILMLKHFFPPWPPPTERRDILFLDDSQQFPSFDRFINETDPTTDWNIGYRVWGASFTPAMSGMQYGYDDADGGPSDKRWWIKLDDPQKEIGDSCLSASPNTKFLYWVDFTSQDPDISWDFVTDKKQNKITPVKKPEFTFKDGTLYFNHGNLSENKNVILRVYNMDGKMVRYKKYTDISGGILYNVDKNLSKGNYVVQVRTDKRKFYSKITLH